MWGWLSAGESSAETRCAALRLHVSERECECEYEEIVRS